MIKEVILLHKRGLTIKRMKQLGLEYGVLAAYLENKIKTEAKLIEILQNKIHGFVRRQLTWFKKEKDVHWFDIPDKEYDKEIETLVHKWYYSS